MGLGMINIIVALDCEAKPLITHFDLQRQQRHAYPLYHSANMQLIVSGVGMLNAATATGYLAGLSNDSAAWLNIGIAGHQTHTLGELYLAHKISNQQTEQSWYPGFTFKCKIPTAGLTSFAEPVTDYHDDLLHDMEAAGFYQAASRFNSAEFIHCLKIVSDNAERGTHNINKHMVTELITTKLETIVEFTNALAAQLARWNEITATPGIYAELLQRWHFSTYQQHQLKQLVKRWSTLHPGQELVIAKLPSLRNSRDVLHYLQKSLDIVVEA